MEYSNDYTYLGTKLKYRLEIEAGGFSMLNDNFEVDIIRGPNVLHFTKYQCELGEDKNWYVCFDTKDLGVGRITAKVTAFVPDTDYPGGVRKEVQRLDLIPVRG